MPRSLWTGAISFGLVSVPVRLATAVREKSVHFHMMNPEGDCRLRRKLYCPETGKEYDFKETARGYEVSPGQYVLVDEEEIDKLRPEKGRSIDIEEFVELASVDPIYYEKTYYLLPGEGGDKAYKLLVESMQEAGRAAVAHFTMRKKQHLAVIRPLGEALVLHTLHYADEVTMPQDMAEEFPKEAKVSKSERSAAKQLISSMDEQFDPEKYHDDFRQQLEEYLGSKAEEETVTVSEAKEPEEAPPTYSLMDALKKSVESSKKSSGGKKKTKKKSKSA
jgi:DNA end-binding protein Ku